MAESLEQAGGGESMPPVAEPPSVQAADVSTLVAYLKAVIPALLEENNQIHPSFQRLLTDGPSLERMRKFISDPQTKALLIQRSSVKGLY